MNTWGALVIDETEHDARNNGNGNVTAAALPLRVGTDRVIANKSGWQDEVWAFYDALGEFRYGVTWLAEMVARCRLTAAIDQGGGDEPAVLTENDEDADPIEQLAIDIVKDLAGGIGGQAEILETLATFLSIPGEGWIIGEDFGTGTTWRVVSADEIRRGGRGQTQVMSETSTPDKQTWRYLANDSLVVRVWRPHKRLRYLADSPAQAARDIMRELILINRKIQAQYLSRLASAGMVVFPSEVTFPVPAHLKDHDDPFVAAWVEAAAEAIQTPGTAAAVVPIPIRVPGEYVDKIRHIDFTTTIDEKELEKRNSAIKRLATTLDIPAEVLLGMGDVNHWTAWQLEESSIKVHISPVMEVIVGALTAGYLHPRMKAAGADPGRIIVWYDTSELTARPDRTESAIQLYDRMEITGQALRRETGFADDDAPDDDELKEMSLRFAIRQPPLTQWAMDARDLVKAPEAAVLQHGTLGDDEVADPRVTEVQDEEDARTRGRPGTQEAPPPAGNEDTT